MMRNRKHSLLLPLLLSCVLCARVADECQSAVDESECKATEGGDSDAAATGKGGCGCGAGALSRGEQQPQEQPASASDASPEAALGAERPPPRLLWVEGGEFTMGHDNRSISPSTFVVDGEGPSRRVALVDFWLSETEVSNAQWAAFAQQTGYKSDSERFGWSFVFQGQLTPEADAKATQAVQSAPWWYACAHVHDPCVCPRA